jgi:DNA-binding CsgD family transcriptional regulator
MEQEEIVERDYLLNDEELEEHRRLNWEHYRRLFKETKYCLYYINSRGYVEKYFKRDLTEGGPLSSFFYRVPMKLYQRKTKGKNEEYVSVIIDHVRYPMKKLVAMTFSRIWEPGSKIYHRNKKNTNCNFKNLLIIPPGKKFDHTHKGKQIAVLINKRWVPFQSLKEAADELGVSLSSFRRHINNKNKNLRKSQIKKIKFKYI